LKRFPEEDIQKFPDIEGVSENTNSGLDNRGGAGPVAVWFAKTVVVDFAIKVAIAGLSGLRFGQVRRIMLLERWRNSELLS